MTKIIGFTFVVALSAMNRHALADDACYPQDRADAYIQDFKIAPDTFEGGRDLCRHSSQLVKLFKTIDYLREVEFAETIRPPFVPGLLSTKYYDYLKTRVRFINGPLAGCRGGSDLACAGGLGELVVANGFFAQRTPLRAATIVHELRHLDGDFRHVPCTQGTEKGNVRSCDETFESGGSYAVQIEYLARLFLFAKNIPDGDRLAAKGLALYLAQNKINQSPFVGRKAVALIDQADGSVVLYDGIRQRFFRSLFPAAQFVARDRAFNVVPLNRSQNSSVFDPYLWAEVPSQDTWTDPEIAGRAFTKGSPWLDAIRFGRAGEQALLFADRIEVIGPTATALTPLSKPIPIRWLQDPLCGEGDGTELTGRTKDGQLWQFAVNKGAVEGAKPLACSWPARVRDFVKLDNAKLLLLDDGTVGSLADSGEVIPVAEWTGRRFRQMVRLRDNFFWDFVQTEKP